MKGERTVRAPHRLDIRKASALEVEGGLRISEFGVTRQTQKDGNKSTQDISREYEYPREEKPRNSNQIHPYEVL